MISTSNTHAVQGFIRFVAWLTSFIIFSLLIILPLSLLSKSIFGTIYVLAVPTAIFIVWVCGIIAGMFYILPEWEKMVLLRLGKFDSIRGAGFFVIPPFIYSVASIVDTRIETYQVEATATLTKDNVPTKVTAAIEFKVEDARRATIDVQNYRNSVTWLSTEALKNTIGSLELKELLSERDQIAESLKVQIDTDAAIYGIDIRAVRITDVDTPPSLVEELAVIAREQRASEAKQIQASAEVQVAEKLKEASLMLTGTGAMRLRELQIINEMSKEESSMVIIYPYGDRAGEEIANASAGSAKPNSKAHGHDVMVTKS